jgi:site-specific DNA-methyltransferase (adenine-specific)
MRTEAAGAGFVKQSAHGRLPRLQIVTIEEILDGRLPKMPPLPQVDQTVRPRQKTTRDQLELLLPVAGEGPREIRGDFIDPRFMKFGSMKGRA